MTTAEIKEELEYRIDVDSDLKFEPRNVVGSIAEYEIVERNGWQGLRINGCKILIPSIFDKVTVYPFLNTTVAVPEINGAKQLWYVSCETSKVVINEFFKDVEVYPVFESAVLKDEDGEYLFSIHHGKMIFDTKKMLVSRNPFSKLIWAQIAENEWLFKNLTSNIEYLIKEDITPIEHADFGAYMKPDGEIILLYGDFLVYRKTVAKNGGRIVFSNSVTDFKYFADAAGFVLN